MFLPKIRKIFFPKNRTVFYVRVLNVEIKSVVFGACVLEHWNARYSACNQNSIISGLRMEYQVFVLVPSRPERPLKLMHVLTAVIWEFFTFQRSGSRR